MDKLEVTWKGDLQRVTPQPGDVFVLTTERMLSLQQCDQFKAYLVKAFGPAKIIVLCDGLRLDVVCEAKQ